MIYHAGPTHGTRPAVGARRRPGPSMDYKSAETHGNLALAVHCWDRSGLDGGAADRDARAMPKSTSARSIATLTISFGLVAIPVHLYSATVASEHLAFHLLRKKDGSRVKQQFVAVNDGKLVDRSDMV